jgi:DNA-binding NtrC family response regulator
MKKHILAIDDEQEIRELLCEVMNAAGYRVTAVSSIVEALAVLRTDPPQLVITDLQLEENDGFDLADQVKAVAPKTPIMLLSGVLFDPEVLNGPVGERIAAYVEKTAPLERILSEVKRLLPA